MTSPVRAFAVVDLGWGDSSKGAWVDFLCREHGANLVVRASGGCQCGHNVIEPSGLHHCFSQVGAGTFAGADTHLAAGMLVEPLALARELEVLMVKGFDPIISIDPMCVITTPFHQILNRAFESQRGTGRHGSCGLGIGETRADELNGLALRIKDISDQPTCRRILQDIACSAYYKAPSDESRDQITQIYIWQLAEDYNLFTEFFTTITLEVALKLKRVNTLIFEGNQGVLLDETHGFAPHTTWTDCTFRPAQRICDEAGIPLTKIGCLRAYATRHGAGPFPSECPDTAEHISEPHNVTDPWQGDFRVGHFDAVLARYAIHCSGGVDELAISHLDKFVEKPWGMVDHYRHGDHLVRLGIAPNPKGGATLDGLTKGAVLWTETPLYDIEREVMPVTYTAHGPTHKDRRIIR